MKNPAAYVYGPVPSRRLGRSLGIDLVPPKTCTYDCIYCQLGPTTCKTVRRREWVPLGGVLGQLEGRLGARPDYVTLAGSGEPTLFGPLGELIAGIKDRTDVPVAVLTNGSLLWRPEVRRAVAAADLVAPSLDAGDDRLFRYVNRPHPRIRFEQMVEGLVAFREAFAGRYWLEVFLLGGVTAIAAEVEKIAAIAARIRPDRVQINTVTRPPAEAFAIAADRARLEELAGLFGGRAEVVADYRGPAAPALPGGGRQALVELLRRRPSTARQIADGLGLHPHEVAKCLRALEAEGVVRATRRGATLYYTAAGDMDTPSGGTNG